MAARSRSTTIERGADRLRELSTGDLAGVQLSENFQGLRAIEVRLFHHGKGTAGDGGVAMVRHVSTVSAHLAAPAATGIRATSSGTMIASGGTPSEMTAGRPAACASTTAMGNASSGEGNSKDVHRISQYGGYVGPRAGKHQAFAKTALPCLTGQAVAKRAFADQQQVRSRSAASTAARTSTRNSEFFSSVSRPTLPSTKASAGIPNAARTRRPQSARNGDRSPARQDHPPRILPP